MRQFLIADLADQQFDVILDGRRVTVRLRYNVTIERWSLDLSISATPVLHGRRIVTGVDLLAPFDFGIGVIFADSIEGDVAPDYDALVGGTVRLFQIAADELAAAA